MNPELVELVRGGVVESVHRGALAIVDAEGASVCVVGDVQRPVFPRSAVKVLQALPLVASGAAEDFGLTDEELALACASHNGEPRHVVGYMKDFLFRPEQARTPLKALSGGERGRLMLARALARPSNLLVLDEPTNDLDLETLDLLQRSSTTIVVDQVR